jgi:hypothetical protein
MAEPLLTPIERPRCRNCQTRMMVVRIEARRAGADFADLRMSPLQKRSQGAG